MWGFLLSRVARFLPGLGSPWLLVVVATAAFGAGGWTVHKVVKAGEVKALESRIEDLKATASATEETLRAHYQDLLRIERNRVTIREVTEYVPDNRACDLSRGAERMLNQHRQGVPDATGGTVEGSRPATDAPRVSQRQHVLAHIDLADRFTRCRQQLIRLNEWWSQSHSP